MRLAEIWNGDLVWGFRTSPVAVPRCRIDIPRLRPLPGGAQVACHALDAVPADESASAHRL